MSTFSITLEKPDQWWNVVSALQLSLWDGCPRSWGFRYIDKVKVPSPSRALGLALHDEAENYLRHGTPPNEALVVETPYGKRYPGRIFSAGIPLLPKPGTVKVEQHFCIGVDGVLFYGLIDCLATRRVIDHKTCSSFRWQMTPEELLDDEQGILYGVVPRLLGETQPVVCAWHYYRTSGEPEVRVTEAVTDARSQLGKIGDVLLPRAKEILAARRDVQAASELPRKTDYCPSYGGCPHKERCLTSKERLGLAMGFDIDAFADEQQEKLKNAPPPLPPEEPEAPPPPHPEPPAAPEASAGPPVPQESEGMYLGDMGTWTRAQLKSYAMSKGLVDGGCRFHKERLLKVIAEGAPSGSAPLPEEPEAPPPPPEEPEAPPPPPEEPEVPPPPEEPERKQAPPVVRDYSVGTLYIDCLPQQGERPESLSHILREANENLCTESFHYRLESDLEFGKAGAAISAAVAPYLKGQDVYASMRLAEHRDCMAMLEGCAKRVIKGG